MRHDTRFNPVILRRLAPTLLLAALTSAAAGQDGQPDPAAVSAVLASWGPCPIDCLADIDHDGLVDTTDLLHVLAGVGLVKDGSIPPPGYVIVEGDIQMPVDKDGRLLTPEGTFAAALWPTNAIPYEFDSNMTTTQENRALTAMQRWEDVSALNFVARNGETAYLHFQNATVNNSPVGYKGNEQIINISNWNSFTVEHEIGHSLGLWHEQTRADRNSFVTINTDNIQSGAEGNFDIRDNGGEYGPYDFDSVMHYPRCAFSTGCPPGTNCNCTASTETITVLPPNDTAWANAIGQRDHLSDMDQLTMSFMYPESNWRFADGNYTGLLQYGTFRQPMKTVAGGVAVTPSGGVLWIQPDSYPEAGVFDKAMVWRAPLGGVVIGN